MLRRLTASLVIWLGLLGAGLPALACSVAASVADCCPHELPPPCQGDEGFAADLAPAMCCAAEAPPLGAASLGALRDSQARDHESSSPDLPALPAPIIELAAIAAAPRFSTLPIPSLRSDAALTYLRTGRLRL